MTAPPRPRFRTQTQLDVPAGAASPQRRPYSLAIFSGFAESIARFLGTGRYLAVQTLLVLAWIVLNTLAIIHHWDPYPFILLNLAFSTQAAYAAPLILLAANRQDDRDRATIDRDREVAARTQADTAYLIRELAGIRLALADAVTTEDLSQSVERLAKQLTDTPPITPAERRPST
jgi:uncharacterized membrane protein